MPKRDDNDFAKNFVANRGRRCSATILSWMEKNIYEYLPKESQERVRRTVLDNVNDLSDVAIDIVKSDVGAINDFWVEGLESIHNELRRIQRG